MIGWIGDRLATSETEHPVDRLAEFINFFVIHPEDESQSLALAILELRLQAIHNETFREKLTAHYQGNVDTVAEIIADGIEAGVFQPVDPAATGEGIYTALIGARTYQITLKAGPATERMTRFLWQTAQHFLFTDAGNARLETDAYPAERFSNCN